MLKFSKSIPGKNKFCEDSSLKRLSSNQWFKVKNFTFSWEMSVKVNEAKILFNLSPRVFDMLNVSINMFNVIVS